MKKIIVALTEDEKIVVRVCGNDQPLMVMSREQARMVAGLLLKGAASSFSEEAQHTPGAAKQSPAFSEGQ